MFAPIDLLKDEVTHKIYMEARKRLSQGQDPFRFLLEQKAIPRTKLLSMLSRHLQLPFANLESFFPQDSAMNMIKEETARRFNVLPLFKLEDQLFTAMWNPEDLTTLDYLRQLTKHTVEPVIADPVDLEAAINRQYLSKEKAAEAMTRYDEESKERKKADIKKGEVEQESLHLGDTDAPAIKLVTYIISQAINLNASDVHLERYPERVSLRYRVDGVLHEFPPPPKHIYKAVVARIKIISNMDVAEKRMPQDGRSTTIKDGRKYDLRVSIIPNMHDEGVVIRILDTESKDRDLVDLGFNEKTMKKFKRQIHKPYGIILVTGPTGSGKSTTLYAGLKEIYTPKKKIITIEDPVEYQLEGVTQIQVNPVIGFDFAKGLRSILRHDPDIIMLGEIRDHETAEISIRASLTGHLVLSTLHTNDAPTAIVRLVDMGIPSYLVLSSVNGVLAQRLVRLLCPKCKQPIDIPLSEMDFLQFKYIPPDTKFYGPVGCSVCNNLGYRGREAITEILEIAPEMRHLPSESVTISRIREIAKTQGYDTLTDNLLDKFIQGKTSLEEVATFVTIRDVM